MWHCAVAAALALAVQPGAPACRAPAPLASRRAAMPVMLAGRKKKDDDDAPLTPEEYKALEEEPTLTGAKDKKVMVDPMTTPLQEDLAAMPGPPIVPEPEDDIDPRPLFAFVGLYGGGLMPSEALQEEYDQWLAEGMNHTSYETSSRITLPHYMLSAEEFDPDQILGDRVTEEELAALDAADAAREAAGEPPPSEMVKLVLPFISGHFTVLHADDADDAASWAAGDPIDALGGYSSTSLLRWDVSDDPELHVPLMDGASVMDGGKNFVVHCLDKAGSTELRGATRSDHLRWLKESGRVCYGGPLVSVAEEKVGTLLVVNGDNLEQVLGWASEDPYAAAGLFEQVTVAPILTYGSVQPLPMPEPAKDAVAA